MQPVGLSPEVQQIFKLPLEKRLKRGIAHLKEWQKLTEKMIQHEVGKKGPKQITLQHAWANVGRKFTDIHKYHNTILGMEDFSDEEQD